MKKFIKQFIPPIIINFYHSIQSYNFKKFWKKNKKNFSTDHELAKMIEFFINSKNYKFTSNYWNYLNIKNLKQLIDSGKEINHYATSVAKNYFTFIDVEDEMINTAIDRIENKVSSDSLNLFKKQPNLSYIESMKYNNLVYLLWLNVKKTENLDKLDKLSDLGYLSYNDPFIEINGTNISSDKINSIFDYEKINRFANLSAQKNMLEIGAGSGRTSQSILTFNKDIKYVICDIPPALYISYERLKKVFKDKKIGFIYKEKDKKSLNLKISKLDISFIMPDQLNLIEKNFFDLTIAIDCIHEMDKATIKKYFDNINHISKLFYFSVWKNTMVPFSSILPFKKNDLNYYKNSYDIPSNWTNKFEEELIFPSNSISSGYKID
tara:strand:+ start:1616 stop:2752 length:1137 start_codon:yes stop_codon:yes gene_type:complete